MGGTLEILREWKNASIVRAVDEREFVVRTRDDTYSVELFWSNYGQRCSFTGGWFSSLSAAVYDALRVFFNRNPGYL